VYRTQNNLPVFVLVQLKREKLMKQAGAVSQERSRLFRSVKTRLSLFLGLLMFTFGFLKFVSPTIDGWFHVQIQQSHLPHAAILTGKIAEITTGVLFLLPRFRPCQAKWESRILLIACSSLFLEMLVAAYVHLQPGVPPEVLPLGIKPPVIPLFVLLLDVMVAILVWSHSRNTPESPFEFVARASS
jgi:uncharacterized membrane protein